MKKYFLIIGLVLSLGSKLLQFYRNSQWGDLLVIPAAIFFMLSLLLYNKTYCRWLSQANNRRIAISFAAACCLSVVMFQLLTMFLLGRGELWGMAFAVPLFLFVGFALYLYRILKARPDP